VASTLSNIKGLQILAEGDIMTSRKEPVERRQQERFQVHGDAIVMLKPAEAGSGQLIDISMGGLTFEQYVSSQGPPIEATQLHILLTGTGFSLRDLPCQSIWDLTIYERPHASVYKKRYGVQFGALTKGQIRLLEYFIQNHTKGDVQVS
jgi:hypothetical protein